MTRPRYSHSLDAPTWHGMLCIDNHTGIAARIQRMLDGKWHTTVVTTSDSGILSTVRTSNRLTGPIRVSYDGEHAYIGWSDGSYSWGIGTESKTEADARAGLHRRQVHLAFEHDRTLTIEHASISGNRLCWVIATEDHTE